MNEKTVIELISRYYSLYPDAERIPCRIIVTGDMDMAYRELRPESVHHKMDAMRLQDYNGLMVAPSGIEKPICLLINESKIREYDGSYTWAGTIAHELTHAIDYTQVARLDRLDSYTVIDNSREYNMFRLWTEYHARKRGYLFRRTYIGEGLKPSDEQILFIQREECPFQKQYFLSQYGNCQRDYDQVYNAMNFLGRYSVWCDLFPDVFSEETLAEDLEEFNWPQPLYRYLREHETLEKSYTDFGRLEKLLNGYWPDI